MWLSLLAVAGFVDDASILTADGFKLHKLGSNSIFHALPSANSTESLLEQAVQPATSSYEESGAFHQVDPQRISLYGDSALLTRHTLEGIDITDSYFDGAAAFRIPWLALSGLSTHYSNTTGVARDQITYHLVAPEDLRPRLQFGGSWSYVGGTTPGAVALMDKFSGSHATQRTPAPPSERRRLLNHRVMAGAWVTETHDVIIEHFLEATLGERRFLDFVNATPSARGTVDEPYAIVTYLARLRPHDNAFHGYLALEFRQRDHAFAESYFNTNEQATRTALTLFGGLSYGRLKLGTTLQWMRLEANQAGFTREIADIDGESLRPWYSSAHVVSLHSSVRYDHTFALSNAFVESDSWLSAMLPAGHQHWSNPLTFQGAPAGRWDWTSNYTAEWRQALRLGLRDTIHREWWTLDYDGYLFSSLTLNAQLRNTVSWLDLGAHATFTLHPTTWFRGYVGFAKTPVEPTAQMTRMLDPQYLSGRQRDAAGNVIDSFGGAFTTVDDPRFNAPNILSAFLGLEVKPIARLALRAQGFVKQYDHTPWLTYRNGEASAGTTSDGFFYLNTGDKNVRLASSPYEPSFTPGVTFQASSSDDDRYFVSVAFSAYVTIGRSPFGNGATASDPFLLDPSTANPNNNRNGLANLESDRAYVGKIMIGGRIIDTLWLSGTIRYRDGQPFALYEYSAQNQQVSVRYATPRGSLYRLEGPREDAHWGIDAKVSYSFAALHAPVTVSVVGSNLLDLGNTIQERSTDRATQGRAALELQVPRTIFASIEIGL